jgi:hypothetical protein
MQRGSFKRPPIKKEATPRNAKGLIRKTSDEKSGNPKKRKAGFANQMVEDDGYVFFGLTVKDK